MLRGGRPAGPRAWPAVAGAARGQERRPRGAAAASRSSARRLLPARHPYIGSALSPAALGLWRQRGWRTPWF
eukprot:6036206-Alexandrium_andersonii.AAC.1